MHRLLTSLVLVAAILGTLAYGASHVREAVLPDCGPEAPTSWCR